MHVIAFKMILFVSAVVDVALYSVDLQSERHHVFSDFVCLRSQRVCTLPQTVDGWQVTFCRRPEPLHERVHIVGMKGLLNGFLQVRPFATKGVLLAHTEIGAYPSWV